MSNHRLSVYIPQGPREQLAIVALFAAGLFVFGGDLWQMIGRMRHEVRNEVRDHMPLENEIERARQLVASLIPDLRRNHEVIIREQVEISELQTDITQHRQRLQGQRDQLLTSKDRLRAKPVSSTEFKHADFQSKQELRRRFTNYQSEEATLNAKAQILAHREEALAKAMTAQDEMLNKKRELELQVAQLSTRIQLIRQEGVNNHVVINREKLARCDELVRYLRKRLTIDERIAEFPDQVTPDLNFSERDEELDDVASEIDRYFEQTTASKADR